MRSIPKEDFGAKGEIFIRIFDGKPIDDILARTDITGATKDAAVYFREKFDRERATIVQRKRADLLPSVRERIERQLREEGFAAPPEGRKRRNPEEMVRLLAERDRLAEDRLREMVPDTWGLRDYLPHMFPGEYIIRVKVGDEYQFLTSAR